MPPSTSSQRTRGYPDASLELLYKKPAQARLHIPHIDPCSRATHANLGHCIASSSQSGFIDKLNSLENGIVSDSTTIYSRTTDEPDTFVTCLIGGTPLK